MPEWVDKYFRTDFLPHIWCPGCGHGTVLGALARAIARSGLDQDNIAVVSGIGCSSRGPGYLEFDTLHTTHGRALAFATGLKMGRPDLHVIVLTGDGDVSAIGGNHLIHAGRRNIDLTVVCMNNNIYGMTGGQASPMTPQGMLATTAPYGAVEKPFDLCKLVTAAGGTYVARTTTYHVRQMEKLIGQALAHKGFSFVEAVSQCPTYFGRRNQLKSTINMMNYLRDKAVRVEKAGDLSEAERAKRIVIGEIHVSEEPEFVSEYERSAAAVRQGG